MSTLDVAKLDSRILAGVRPLTAEQRLARWRRDWEQHWIDELIEAVEALDLQLDNRGE